MRVAMRQDPAIGVLEAAKSIAERRLEQLRRGCGHRVGPGLENKMAIVRAEIAGYQERLARHRNGRS